MAIGLVLSSRKVRWSKIRGIGALSRLLLSDSQFPSYFSNGRSYNEAFRHESKGNGCSWEALEKGVLITEEMS